MNVSTSELVAMMGRMRRQMPRNIDVETVCNEFLQLLVEQSRRDVDITPHAQQSEISTAAPTVISTSQLIAPCELCRKRRINQARAQRRWRRKVAKAA